MLISGQSGAMAEIEWEASSRLIVVTGSPDECDSLEVLAEKLRDSMIEHRISGITDIYDKSTEDAAVLTIHLKRDANAQTILDEVHRHLPSGEDGT